MPFYLLGLQRLELLGRVQSEVVGVVALIAIQHPKRTTNHITNRECRGVPQPLILGCRRLYNPLEPFQSPRHYQAHCVIQLEYYQRHLAIRTNQ